MNDTATLLRETAFTAAVHHADHIDTLVTAADRAYTRRARRRATWLAVLAFVCAGATGALAWTLPAAALVAAGGAVVTASIWALRYTRATRRTPGQRAALLLLRHELALETNRRA